MVYQILDHQVLFLDLLINQVLATTNLSRVEVGLLREDRESFILLDQLFVFLHHKARDAGASLKILLKSLHFHIDLLNFNHWVLHGFACATLENSRVG